MKITFLSFYSGNVYRGVETFVHELANKLVSLGHDVVVYQGGPKLKDTIYETVQIPVQINLKEKNSNLPYVNYFANKVKEFTRQSLARMDRDTDIIFPTNGQWQSLLCKFWAKKNKAKMVIAGQTGPGIDERLNVLTFPDAFVGLTDFQVDWARKANPFIKIEKIPNGVDLNKFHAKIDPVKIKLTKPVILCVAALDPWKRLDLTFKAVSKLNNTSLLLVGKGKEEEKLQNMGKEMLTGRFEILSFSHDQMSHVYPSADLFTYPTAPWESFGIVLVEAMACNLPVVATNDPIRKEIVGEAGLFVDPTDTDEYANALKEALKRNWDNLPRKQAEKFSWDNIAKHYEVLFESLINK